MKGITPRSKTEMFIEEAERIIDRANSLKHESLQFINESMKSHTSKDLVFFIRHSFNRVIAETNIIMDYMKQLDEDYQEHVAKTGGQPE